MIRNELQQSKSDMASNEIVRTISGSSHRYDDSDDNESDFDSQTSLYESNSDYEYEYVDEDETSNTNSKKIEEEAIRCHLLGVKRKAHKTIWLEASDVKQQYSSFATNLRGFNYQSQQTCQLCGAENHSPGVSCQHAAKWLETPHSGITTWPSEYVFPSIAFRTNECSKLWDLSNEETATILQQHGWNVEALNRNMIDLYRNDTAQPGDEVRVDQIDTIESEDGNAGENSRMVACGICMETYRGDELFSLGCSHMFCSTCWKGYIQAMFEGNFGGLHGLEVRCPTPGCTELVGHKHIEKVAPDLIPRFKQLCLDSFVRSSAVMRWCPGPGCKNIAIRARNDLFVCHSNSVVCDGKDGCQTTFCFLCGQDPHDGPCPDAAPLQVEEDQQQGQQNQANVVSKNLKRCPSCNVVIEKTGGCNHMTCKCGTHFCWLCGADISDNPYGHHCGREPNTLRQRQQNNNEVVLDRPRVVNLDYIREALENKATDTAVGALFEHISTKHEELDRFAHYYNRFVAHHQGQQFAEGQCDCVNNRVDAFQKLSGIKSGADSECFVQANQLLVASRRLLKYSYCYVYLVKERTHTNETEQDKGSSKSQRLDLFQNYQEQLERFTEQLSEVSEQAVTRIDRRRILDLVRYPFWFLFSSP